MGIGAERLAQLDRLLADLDPAALNWVSGYIAGLAAARGGAPAAQAAAVPQAGAGQRLTIVSGSQTGNAQRIAAGLAKAAAAQGLEVRHFRAGEYPVRDLAKEKLLYLVFSTQGDGDPPDEARAFHDFLMGRKAPKLPDLEFAVLGLGDSSYPKFCEISRRLEERLLALGGKAVSPRVDCDLDFDKAAAAWTTQVVGHARERGVRAPVATVTPLFVVPSAPAHDRERPFAAELVANQRITGRGSDKDVRHLELSLTDSGITYEPGDSLGVRPENPPETVAGIIELLGARADEPVERDGRTLPLAEWLGRELEITLVTKPLLESIASRSGAADDLKARLAPGASVAMRELMKGSQLVSLLARYRPQFTAAELVATLRPLAPRMYSIASSQKRVGDEVHLTVALVEDEQEGRRVWGAATRHLSLLDATAGVRVPVFVERNERFRLPADASRDVVMIGPGTGVAPFRAFVQERAETGARGRNWLFFGARRFSCDFLYQLEWQEALKKGELARIDLAFSRDTDERVYVQRRIREAGRELYAWLDGGASVYVCGDADRMAPDVHAALAEVIAEHGGVSGEDSLERLNEFAATGRYLRDVY
ncbi:MAG: assimilatory sulfite reductase (NADPH) flavoprotein subunit [Steroidobacteraceae bacterium]